MLCAGLPSSVRLCFGQPCSPTRNGRFARPCDRSTYTYTASGSSPVQSASPKRVPLGCGPDRDRAWHLWSSSSREEYPRLRYRSTRRCSRVFRSPSASLCCVAGIPAPCLTRACRRNPRTASPRVTPLSAQPLSPLPHHMLNPFKHLNKCKLTSNAQIGLLQWFGIAFTRLSMRR